MLDELIVAASIGTSRKAPAFPSVSPAVDEALAAVGENSPEAKLLAAVAILSRYRICGRIPPASNALPEAAEAESLPSCTGRAGDLLAQILGMNNNDTKAHLADEWLALAARAQRRASHRLLPALLDYGAARKSIRPAIAAVAGARGQWLMRLNPRWKFETVERGEPAALWSTGTRDERIALLRRVRLTDPGAARDLIISTWKEDAAEDRSAFVSALLVSLQDADEPFLEACLDDRSKQVRAAAVEVLARLPRSALVRRMTERANPLLRFVPEKKTGILRKTTPATVEVLLPSETFVSEWARDGVAEKPEGKIGRRQWWLQQFLAAIPPSHWSARSELPPAECIAALDGDFADVVLSGWHQAAARHPDPKWIAALLLAAKEGRGPMSFALLNALPDDARLAIAAELLESPRVGINHILQLLGAMEGPLDRHGATALFNKIGWNLAQNTAGTTYTVSTILQAAALRVPPESYDDLASRATGPAWEPVRKAADEFFLNLQIRRDLQREFTS